MTIGRRVLVFATMSVALGFLAAPRSPAAESSSDKSAARTVDLFDAIASGDIDVKYIPKDSKQAQMVVKNNTDQPLTVKLPDAFAATPVLAQAAGGAGGGNRTQRNNNNNQNQSTGGGFGGGGGAGQNRGGGGQFNIAPEKTTIVKAETVCLEHGKASPASHVAYEIKPIEAYTDDPKVQELCKLLGKGEASQRAIQAAAWHFANHMSWEELSNKKTHHLVGGDEQYFSADEIHAAMKIADVAIKAADALAEQPSTDKKASPYSSTSTGG